MEVFKMINSIFISLAILSFLATYKRITRNKKKSSVPPTHQLPSEKIKNNHLNLIMKNLKGNQYFLVLNISYNKLLCNPLPQY